jgi:hypothetical protein
VRATVQTGQRNLADVDRVVVATYLGLGHTAFDYDVSWLDVVVVLNACEALGQLAQPCLAAAFRARLYGLLDRNDRLAPYESDQLRALFGFREVVVPQHGCAERPVRVVWQAIRGGPMEISKSKSSFLEQKRRGVWRNPLRNRRIARLAQRLAANYCTAMTTVSPDLADGATPSVRVLVENVEHGLNLAKKLGWPLLADPDLWPAGLSQADRSAMKADTAYWTTKPQCAVVTATAFGNHSWADVDVLVRADGGVGTPSVLERGAFALGHEPVRPLVLIDFDDHQDPGLRRWSRRRRQAYRERGWLAAGEEPFPVRVQAFLECHSEGSEP